MASLHHVAQDQVFVMALHLPGGPDLCHQDNGLRPLQFNLDVVITFQTHASRLAGLLNGRASVANAHKLLVESQKMFRGHVNDGKVFPLQMETAVITAEEPELRRFRFQGLVYRHQSTLPSLRSFLGMPQLWIEIHSWSLGGGRRARHRPACFCAEYPTVRTRK